MDPFGIGAIATGVGSVIGGLGGLFGGGGRDSSGMEDAINRASALQYAAAQRAQGFTEQELQNARNYMRPYVDAGGNALSLYGGLLNVPGFDSVDPTATLRATPGYDWQMSQGVNALDRSAAARGMLGSGAQGKALTKFGQGLGDQTYNNYLNRLQGLVSSGQNAAALQGNYGMQAAPTVGNFLTQGAQAQGQGLMGAQMARQSAYGQNNLASSLGLIGGGLATMPWGKIGNSLKSWWGGGTSSPGEYDQYLMMQ